MKKYVWKPQKNSSKMPKTFSNIPPSIIVRENRPRFQFWYNSNRETWFDFYTNFFIVFRRITSSVIRSDFMRLQDKRDFEGFTIGGKNLAYEEEKKAASKTICIYIFFLIKNTQIQFGLICRSMCDNKLKNVRNFVALRSIKGQKYTRRKIWMS